MQCKVRPPRLPADADRLAPAPFGPAAVAMAPARVAAALPSATIAPAAPVKPIPAIMSIMPVPAVVSIIPVPAVVMAAAVIVPAVARFGGPGHAHRRDGEAGCSKHSLEVHVSLLSPSPRG